MRFTATPVDGVTIVELEPLEDSRGFFARAFDAEVFAERGLNPRVVQTNHSHNLRRGTLRGLHYQHAPHQEAKLIRCISGAAFVVAVDLRPDSPTHLQHASVELRRDNLKSLYIPEGCAAGMQALEDDTDLLYQVSAYYAPEAEGGLRYDDPALAIPWPLPVATISDKDAAWPYLDRAGATA
jgi:dTDP-4-dehydrorhamnose 3,5-epimerase